MSETPVFVYDTFDDPEDSLLESILATLIGMRYMALTGSEWPKGYIEAYGFTKAGAYRRAVRKFNRRLKREASRQQMPVAEWTEAGERVR